LDVPSLLSSGKTSFQIKSAPALFRGGVTLLFAFKKKQIRRDGGVTLPSSLDIGYSSFLLPNLPWQLAISYCHIQAVSYYLPKYKLHQAVRHYKIRMVQKNS